MAAPRSDAFLLADEYTGQTLGKYELACRLSTGGMSEIFLAYQKGVAGFRKYVVLKKILSNITGEEEFVRMFVQEAKITAGFAHQNIAQVFDLDVAEGELFLAMEFVPGATMVELVQACIAANEPVPLGLSVAVVRDVALALHYAHTFTDPAGRVQPVVHRDVAEKNIMVTYEGATKLLDFGIAKRLDRADLTQIGTVKGTSGYMSPEQIRGEKLDPRTDVFSLGVVLHECLVGHRLFYRKSRDEEMIAALNQDVVAPSRKNRDVPAELDAVVLKALAKDRDERYATARDFARAIERAAGNRLWEPEEAGAMVRRFFAQRREETRRLLAGPQVAEELSEVRFAQRLGAPMPAPPTRSDRLPVTATPSSGRAMGAKAEDVTREMPLAPFNEAVSKPARASSGPSPARAAEPRAMDADAGSPAETLPEDEMYPGADREREEALGTGGGQRAEAEDEPPFVEAEFAPGQDEERTTRAPSREAGRPAVAGSPSPSRPRRAAEPEGETSATVVIDDADVLAAVKRTAALESAAGAPAPRAKPRRPRSLTDPGEEMLTAFDLKRAGSPTVAVAIGLGIGLTVVALVYLLVW